MTDAERWGRVKALFDAALERPPDERPAFLRDQCGEDPTLRAEVESLLAADRASHRLVSASPLEAMTPSIVSSMDVVLQERSRVFSAGDRLGRYLVRGFIDAGGMGEVYCAEDLVLQRSVAIKVLPASVVNDRERLARFEREARVLAALNHPHIAAIYGWEEDEGVRALILELVDGTTLAHRLARGALPIAEALAAAAQMASALDAAHEKGIVHRDLKPANIAIAADGSVKVLDFGLAKGVGADGPVATPRDDLTGDDGTWLGTAAYMSPEQVRGKSVDASTDIWALGCVLYEMLAGRAPFAGETMADTVAAILDRQPDWSLLPPDTPAAVRRVLRRALEKDVRRRWRSVGDMQLELEEALRDRGAAMPERTPHVAPASDPPRRPLRGRWIAGLLAATAAMVAGTLLFRGRMPASPPEIRLQIPTPHTWELASFAISPDGSQVVFQATTGGRTQLWLRPLKAEAAEPLTGTDEAYFPFWSPDSQSIGFFADYQLKRIDLGSGLVRTLARTPHARGAAWSGSGTILYASSSGPLRQVPADGGVSSEASRLLPGQLNHRFPHFLPDGRRFLFVGVGTAESRGIYAGALDVPEIRRIIDVDTAGSFLPPRHVLFARQGALWALPVDPDLQPQGDAVLVAGHVLSHPDVAAHKAHSSSAEGTVAYRSAAGEQRLVWLDRTGREIEAVGGPDGGQPGYIRLSADGRIVAMRRTRAGNTDVWLTDVERGIPQRVTFGPTIDWAAAFSPDASRIVFASDRKNGIDDLYERPVAGGTETLLLESLEQKVPLDWSFDGTHILYAVQSVTTGFDLWALPLAGDRKPFPVVRTPFEDGDAKYGAAFSPDGRWLLYQSDQSGQYEIYLQPFPGPGGVRQLSTTGGFSPQWRRDGREVFFFGPDNVVMAAAVELDARHVRIDTPRPLFPMPPDAEYGEYAVSPDGQRFLVSRLVTPPSPITILLNWRRADR